MFSKRLFACFLRLAANHAFAKLLRITANEQGRSGSSASVASAPSDQSTRTSEEPALGPVDPDNIASPSPVKGGRAKEKAKPPCFGCFRLGAPFGNDMSYINPNEVLKWAYEEGRGNWCAECFLAWRNTWSTSHGLTLFGNHIKTSSAFAEWEWSLLATVMLKYKGLVPNATAVAQEAASLKYFCRLIGFPTFRYAVVPLEEYVRDPRNQDARAEDLICCTVRTGGEDRIGVFVDIGPVDRDASLDVAPEGCDAAVVVRDE